MFATRRFGFVAGALLLGGAAQGCSAPAGSSAQVVHARAELVGSTSSGLKTATASKRPMAETQGPGAQIVEVNGIYQGCTDREGPWSVAIESDVALDYPALTVVQNDASCQLIATEVRGDQLYEANAPLPVDLSATTSFSPQGAAGSTSFYASVLNLDPGFGGDFTLVLFYSPDVSQTTADMGVTFSTTSAGLVANQIPAPDYGVDMSQMTIQVDANEVVQSASGLAIFNVESIGGLGYVIDYGTLPPSPTFAQLDALYGSQEPASIDWGGFQVDASMLSLEGSTLPVVRNVVIGTDFVNGVRSYQVITIDFEPPVDTTRSPQLATVRK